MKWSRHKFIQENSSWVRSLYATAALICSYVFMEWIFFVTKPSFMSTMSTAQNIQILLLSSFLLATLAIILEVFIWVASNLLQKVTGRSNFGWAGAIIPAVIASCLTLILVDNFTYTIFGIGVVSTSGFLRAIYAVFFIILLVLFFRYYYKYIHSSAKIPKAYAYFVVSYLAVATVAFVVQIPRSQAYHQLNSNQDYSQLPNIILLGFDGINAENMSLYGYERQTTPNIQALAQDALIAENAFSNSGNTGGSLTALLTGKVPTETRVVYPPDILTGADAYQHLPGILRQIGYHTVQITMPNYGDAYERNIKDGFDTANFRSQNTNPLLKKMERLGGGTGVYFFALISQRITERLEHAFYVKTMDNPYKMVTQPTEQIPEKKRFNSMLSYLREADRPVFIHVHMLTTHGPAFLPRKNVFSEGQEQKDLWMVDFYDDAILDSDRYIGDLFKYLNKSGKIDNTIVIFYSDHGMRWNARKRIPLVMWFPNKEYQGRIKENVQLIDLAPTLLDYLGETQPVWMKGKSLLEADHLAPDRSIFSADTNGQLVELGETGWSVDQAKVFPPFYQLGAVNVIVCDQWFSLNLNDIRLDHGKVDGSSANCPEDHTPSPEEALKLIIQKLRDDQYDTSSLESDVQIKYSETDAKK